MYYNQKSIKQKSLLLHRKCTVLCHIFTRRVSYYLFYGIFIYFEKIFFMFATCASLYVRLTQEELPVSMSEFHNLRCTVRFSACDKGLDEVLFLTCVFVRDKELAKACNTQHSFLGFFKCVVKWNINTYCSVQQPRWFSTKCHKSTDTMQIQNKPVLFNTLQLGGAIRSENKADYWLSGAAVTRQIDSNLIVWQTNRQKQRVVAHYKTSL